MRLLDNCGIKPVLSGLLDGSLFNGKRFSLTQIWISTLIFPATRRRRNLPLRIIPKGPVLLLRPILILRHPFPLEPEFKDSPLVCRLSTLFFFFLCIYIYIYIYPFYFVGPGAWDPCSPLFDKHTFFNDLRSCWDIFFIFLPELYDSNWGFEQLGSPSY